MFGLNLKSRYIIIISFIKQEFVMVLKGKKFDFINGIHSIYYKFDFKINRRYL